jgi:hypothetical protein
MATTGCNSGTIDPALGRETALAFKKEDDWGCLQTPNGSNWTFFPQTSNDISGEIEQLDNPTITGDRAVLPSLAGTDTITGDIELVSDPEEYGYPLYYTFGGYSVTESGTTSTYKHGFYGTDFDDPSNEIPTFSLIRKLGVMNIRMTGGKVDSLSLDQGQNEVLSSTVSVQMRDEEKPPSNEVPSNNVPTPDPFKYRDGSVQVDFGSGLTSVATIEDISIDIGNNLTGAPTIESGQWIGYLEEGSRDVTGTMTVTYEGSQFYDAYQDQDILEIQFTWTSDNQAGSTGDNKDMFVRMPQVKLQTAPQPVDDSDSVLTQDIDFEARKASSASQSLPDGSTLNDFDIYFELFNTTDSGVYNSNT